MFYFGCETVGENLPSAEGSEFKKFTDEEEDRGDNAFENSEASCEVISSKSLSQHSSQSVLFHVMKLTSKCNQVEYLILDHVARAVHPLSLLQRTFYLRHIF